MRTQTWIHLHCRHILKESCGESGHAGITRSQRIREEEEAGITSIFFRTDWANSNSTLFINSFQPSPVMELFSLYFVTPELLLRGTFLRNCKWSSLRPIPWAGMDLGCFDAERGPPFSFAPAGLSQKQPACWAQTEPCE